MNLLVFPKELETTSSIEFKIDSLYAPVKGAIPITFFSSWALILLIVNNSKSNRLIYTNPHEWLYDIPKFFKVVYQKEIAA